VIGDYYEFMKEGNPRNLCGSPVIIGIANYFNTPLDEMVGRIFPTSEKANQSL